MKIRFLSALAGMDATGAVIAFNVGDETSWDDDEARRMIDAGIAEEVSPEPLPTDKSNRIICEHHPEYQVPLILTFAWPYMEYWCPYCDLHTQFLDGGHDYVPETTELETRHAKFIEMARPYLTACSSLNCSKLEYPEGSGQYIKPSELPADIIKQYMAIRDAGWEKWQKAE